MRYKVLEESENFIVIEIDDGEMVEFTNLGVAEELLRMGLAAFSADRNFRVVKRGWFKFNDYRGYATVTCRKLDTFVRTV